MSVTLLDYQQSAVEFLATRKRALIQAPAGSGKTIMAAAALDRVIHARQRSAKVRVGWLANTLEQCQQARDAIAKFPRLPGSIELTVCCPAGAPDEWAMDVLIVDEAHHSPAVTWSAIVEAHKGALWCFTATPFGEDEDRNGVLRSMVNNQIHVVPRKAVAARVLPALVIRLDATDSGLRQSIDKEIDRLVAIRSRGSNLDLDTVKAHAASHACVALGVVPNRARNAAIVRTVSRHAAESVLVLVATVEHGFALSEAIPGAVVVFSKMGKKARREAMAGFVAGKIRVMIATSLADEGFDAPIASVLILAGAGRSAARVEQRTGRVLRTHGTKTHGTIYDFADRQHPVLARQSERRRGVFLTLGYRVEDPAASTHNSNSIN